MTPECTAAFPHGSTSSRYEERERGKREREGGERARARGRRESDRTEGETEEASCDNLQQIVPEGKFIFSLFSPIKNIELPTVIPLI